MGKRQKQNAKKASVPGAPKINTKSITPPESATLSPSEQERLQQENEETSLGLTLGPGRLIAKPPFNTLTSPPDSRSLMSKDRVEFIVSRSILSIASPYFCNLLTSMEEGEVSPKFTLRPCSAFDWEMEEAMAVELDIDSSILDPLLRFVYPVPSPTFKEPANQQVPNELPYRFLGPIYDAAKKYEFSVVTERILEIAKELIHIKSLPEPGLAAIRAYGVACRLKLDYDTRVKAARNALCVPYRASPTTGLEEEGITKADIQRFAEFHSLAVQVCSEFFQISPTDGYPVGLADVYATFVTCAQCSGFDNASSTTGPGPGMRCGAARWWHLYASNAMESLRRAPLDPSIFYESFLLPVFREAQKCSACASVVHWKWCNMMPMLVQTIPARIFEVPLGINLDDDKISKSEEKDDDKTIKGVQIQE